MGQLRQLASAGLAFLFAAALLLPISTSKRGRQSISSKDSAVPAAPALRESPMP